MLTADDSSRRSSSGSETPGFAIGNADVIIHAERPKLGELKREIRESLAALLGLPPDAIGVKATTNEGLDAVGRGEAIACWATVTLTRRD